MTAADVATAVEDGTVQDRGASVLRRMVGFAGLPLISAIAPFLVLPLLSRTAGVANWAALGVGQSVGAVGATIVILGWSVTGPAVVAAADEGDRRTTYLDSLLGRAAVALVVVPAAAWCAVSLSPPEGGLLAALMAVAFAVGGLSPAWYAIGTGSPGLIARYEVLPRGIAILVSAPVLLITRQPAIYPALLVVATLTGLVMFSRRLSAAGGAERFTPRRILAAVWSSRTGASTVILAGLYSGSPVAIMGALLETGPLASFSSIDRLYRIALYAVVAIGNGFQGWVAERRGLSGRARMRTSVVVHGVLGLVGLVGLAVLGRPLTGLAFGWDVAADGWTSLWYGVAFLGVSVTTSTGLHLLVPLGRTRSVLLSTAGGAVVGVTAMLLLGAGFGGAGGAAGLAIGETCVVAIQVAALLAHGRRSGRPAASWTVSRRGGPAAPVARDGG